MACLVAHLNNQLALAVHPLSTFDGELCRFVAQQMLGPGDGAVELGFRGIQAQEFHVVAHDFQHLDVAAHQNVLAVRCARLKPRVT